MADAQRTIARCHACDYLATAIVAHPIRALHRMFSLTLEMPNLYPSCSEHMPDSGKTIVFEREPDAGPLIMPPGGAMGTLTVHIPPWKREARKAARDVIAVVLCDETVWLEV